MRYATPFSNHMSTIREIAKGDYGLTACKGNCALHQTCESSPERQAGHGTSHCVLTANLVARQGHQAHRMNGADPTGTVKMHFRRSPPSTPSSGGPVACIRLCNPTCGSLSHPSKMPSHSCLANRDPVEDPKSSSCDLERVFLWLARDRNAVPTATARIETGGKTMIPRPRRGKSSGGWICLPIENMLFVSR